MVIAMFISAIIAFGCGVSVGLAIGGYEAYKKANSIVDEAFKNNWKGECK